jgi:hypothetical protein
VPNRSFLYFFRQVFIRGEANYWYNKELSESKNPGMPFEKALAIFSEWPLVL